LKTLDYNALLDRLQKLDCCAVSDALDALGQAGVVTGITRQATRQSIAGRVRTMKLAAGQPPQGSKLHLGVRSIDEATDIDVIVIEQRTGVEAAAWGGVLSEAAHHKHIRGVIIDGAVRDVDDINETGLPVFARTITPLSARGRIHEAAVNVPVQVGDVAVEPGDLVIADGTGVVFLKPEVAEEAIARAETIADLERRMVEAVHEHKPVTEIMGKDYETMLGTQE
jgi:regulator of RNase E activity RraA